MSIHSELSKVKDAFSKVRSDMVFLSKQISENYDDFLSKHDSLANKVEKLSHEVKTHLTTIKEIHLSSSSNTSSSDISYLKNQVKELKEEVSNVHKEHFNLSKIVDDIKKDKHDIKDLKEKLHSSELEIFLLKERLVEKDVEIKQLKDVSKTIFDILDDISKVEIDMLNLEHNKSKK